MKRAVVAAGAFALGAIGLNGANVAGLTPQEVNKWWIVSGSLRSFFDDNMFNAPSGAEASSFGLEVKPGVAINLPLSQTLISASYDFTLNYYEARADNKVDQTHVFDTRLNHKFSPRYELDVTENFVASDEPVVSGGAQNVFRRADDASNDRNNINLDFSALISPTFGWLGGYNNNFQDYQSVSYSESLDLVTHAFHLDARWYQTESTLLYAGYRISHTDYTYGKSLGIYLEGDGSPEVYSNIKNSRAHQFYVGAKREVSRRLETSSQIGLQYSDYYNYGTTVWSPYVDITATYKYLPGSSVQVSANVQRYPSDVPVSSSGGVVDLTDVTLDQLIYSASAAVSHKITPRITGNFSMSYQHAVFNGGTDDGKSDNYFRLGLNAEYKIRENLYANMAYAWSKLLSGRDFSEAIDFARNQVYLGVRASY